MVNVLLHPLNAPPLSLTYAPFFFIFLKNSIFSRPKPRSKNQLSSTPITYIHIYISKQKFQTDNFLFFFFYIYIHILDPFFSFLFSFPPPAINQSQSLSTQTLFTTHTPKTTMSSLVIKELIKFVKKKFAADKAAKTGEGEKKAECERLLFQSPPLHIPPPHP